MYTRYFIAFFQSNQDDNYHLKKKFLIGPKKEIPDVTRTSAFYTWAVRPEAGGARKGEQVDGEGEEGQEGGREQRGDQDEQEDQGEQGYVELEQDEIVRSSDQEVRT